MHFIVAVFLSVLTLGVVVPEPHFPESLSETACDDFEVKAVSEVAAIGALSVERGPFDVRATRLVGCIENRGNDRLHRPQLIYTVTPEPERTGNPLTMITEGIAPGETGRFYALVFPLRDQTHNGTGEASITIQRLYMNQPVYEGGEERKQMFDLAPPIEMAYPDLPLPNNG